MKETSQIDCPGWSGAQKDPSERSKSIVASGKTKSGSFTDVAVPVPKICPFKTLGSHGNFSLMRMAPIIPISLPIMTTTFLKFEAYFSEGRLTRRPMRVQRTKILLRSEYDQSLLKLRDVFRMQLFDVSLLAYLVYKQ